MEFNFTREEIKTAIAEKCIKNMIEEYDFDQIADEVKADVKKRFETKIIENIGDTLNSVAIPLLKEILKVPYQRVDRWGEPIGKPTTLKQMFKEKLDTVWSEKVHPDNGGKPDYHSGGITRIEYVAMQTINRYFEKDLNSKVSKILQATKDKFDEAIINIVKKVFLEKLNK